MTVPENPSAGKFGPPPENLKRERARVSGGSRKTLDALGPAALAAGVMALKYFGHSRRGWIGAASGILVGALYVAMYIVGRRRRDAQGGPEPFSKPTNITR